MMSQDIAAVLLDVSPSCRQSILQVVRAALTAIATDGKWFSGTREDGCAFGGLEFGKHFV